MQSDEACIKLSQQSQRLATFCLCRSTAAKLHSCESRMTACIGLPATATVSTRPNTLLMQPYCDDLPTLMLQIHVLSLKGVHEAASPCPTPPPPPPLPFPVSSLRPPPSHPRPAATAASMQSQDLNPRLHARLKYPCSSTLT